MFETKVHYKSYKAGKRWLVAAIGVTALCSGLALMTPAKAATMDQSSSSISSEKVTDDVTSHGAPQATTPVSSVQPAQPTDKNQVSKPVVESTAANADTVTKSVSPDGNKDVVPADTVKAPSVKETTQPVTTPATTTATPKSPVTQTTTQESALTELQAGKTGHDLENVSTQLHLEATNAQGTTVSKSSLDDDSAKLGVDHNETALSVNYLVKNLTTKNQGIWIFLTLPKYLNAQAGITVSANTSSKDLTAGLPTGVDLTYVTTEGNFKPSDEFDWSTLKELELTGVLPAEATYSVTVPMTIDSAIRTTANFSTQNFSSGYAANSLNLDVVAPERTTDPLPVATVQPPITTIDPAVKSVLPAIINNPNGADQTITAPIASTVRLTAENAQGTATSLSSSNNLANYTGTVVDAQATNLAALMNVTNTTDQFQDVNTIFAFPKYYQDKNKQNTSNVVVADSATRADFDAHLPLGLSLTYWVAGKEYNTYQDLLTALPGFTWSDLSEVRVRGSLSGKSSVTLKVPLSVVQNDQYQITGVSCLGAYNYTKSWYTNALWFKSSTKRDDVSGQYEGVVVDTTDTGYQYQVVPKDIQDLMPEVGLGQISYHNFYDVTGNSSPVFMNGGTVTVKMANNGVADAVKDKGYSVTLDAAGAPWINYNYASKAVDVKLKGDLIGKGNHGKTVAPSVYMILRKVITTKDSALKVGDKWQDADNFVAGLDDQDKALTAADVKVTVKDADGVLQNGQVTKAGTFTVTYAYQVASDYYGKGEPYVVSDTATVTVTDPNAGKPTKPATGTDTTGTTPTAPVVTPPTAPDTATTSEAPVVTVETPEVVTTGAGDTATTASATADQPVLVSSGAGDTAMVPTSHEAKTVATATPKTRQGAQADLTTGNTSTPASQTIVERPTSLATRSTTSQTKLATKSTTPLTSQAATKTTLPQTNDQTQKNWVVVGIGTLLGALGLAETTRRKQD